MTETQNRRDSGGRGLREDLLCALIGLARATDGDTCPTHDTWTLMARGLLSALPGGGAADEGELRDQIRRVQEEKGRLVPQCAGCASPCGRNNDGDFDLVQNAPEEIRHLKLALLLGLRSLAECALARDCRQEERNRLLAKGLFAVGEDWGQEDLLETILEMGAEAQICWEEAPEKDQM